MSLRNPASEVAELAEKSLTLLAHASNAVSCVTPASREIASYFVLPGIWCGPLVSPPSYQDVTSVVRFRALHLFSPATYWPSHLILNRNPRYGSNLVLLTVKRAISPSPRSVVRPTPGRPAG